MLNLKNGWVEIKLIEEGTLTKTVIQGKATLGDEFVYFEGSPTFIQDKVFIHESKIIAHE